MIFGVFMWGVGPGPVWYWRSVNGPLQCTQIESLFYAESGPHGSD